MKMTSKHVVKRPYDIEFCAQCGTLLPPPDMKRGFIICPVCMQKWLCKEVRQELRAQNVYVYPRTDLAEEETEENASSSAAGPTVHRKCSKCGNDTMSYATRQTRSADEGMTVFFTCTKCGHKDIEYT